MRYLVLGLLVCLLQLLVPTSSSAGGAATETDRSAPLTISSHGDIGTVTRAEFRTVRRGTTRAQVQRAFHAKPFCMTFDYDYGDGHRTMGFQWRKKGGRFVSVEFNIFDRGHGRVLVDSKEFGHARYRCTRRTEHLRSGTYGVVGSTGRDAEPTAHPHRKYQRRVPAGRTRISLNVQGCGGCPIQAVQNRRGTLPYTTEVARVRAGKVNWVVPTRRTRHMAFLVYAPFDEIAQGGYPMVVVAGVKGRRAGSHIAPAYLRKNRSVSGCWAGTRKAAMTNTLRVRKVRLRNPISGPGLYDSAAGSLERTLPTRPYWMRTKKAALHASDPSICK